MKNFKILSFVFLFSALYFLPFVSSADITTGLFGHWSFDDGTASDQSGNGRNGTMYGGFSATTGKIGQALSFDGVKSYADIGSLDLTTDFTISAWIKTNGSAGNQSIMSKNYETYQFFVTPTNSISFQGNNSNLVTTSANAIILNNWHHVVVTYGSATGARIYVDGFLVKEKPTATNPLGVNNVVTKIGAMNRIAQNFFNGLIDDVRIYNRPLSSADIQELYSIALPTAVTNPSTSINSLSADVNATVNANNQTTVAYFQYGTASGVLSNQTSNQTITGNTDTNIMVKLSGLLANTAYYYRIVATNIAGTVYGQEQSLTTRLASPILSITVPSISSTYNSRSNKITISGTATDTESSISQITYSSNANSGTANGTNNWIIPDMPLNQGSNTITITARDSQNDINTKIITIVYTQENFPIDFPNTSPWKAVPIRTQAQKDAGLTGGEGMQMIHSISYAPSNPNVVYFAVDTSQVWKSVDGGNNWYSKRNGFRAVGGVSLVVDPKDENTVFVSGSKHTGADGASRDTSIADGIYRTTDGGDNWQLVYQTDYYRDKEGQHFVFDPDSFDGTRHQTIYAGTHSAGILKSIDGGTIWTKLQTNTNLDSMRILDMEIHKNKAEAILYIAASNQNKNNMAVSSSGFYKVIDNNGAITAIATGNLPDYPRTMAVSIQSNPSNDILYVAAGNSKVYKSTDGGNSFVSKSNGLETNGEYKNISISPAEPNYLYLKTHLKSSNFFYSHDGGETWLKPSNFDEGNLVLDPGEGYNGTQVAPHPTDKNIAITHLQADKLLKTVNGGQTWRYTGNGYMGTRRSRDKTSAYFDPNNPARTIFFLVDHGPIITEDGGSVWRRLKVPSINGKTTLSGAVDPNNPNIIITAVGTWLTPVYTLIRTTNGGNNESDWNTVYPAIRGEDLQLLSFHPQNSNYVYAGFSTTVNSIGLISRNGGLTWTSVGNKAIRAVYPGNGDIIYAIELPALGNSKLWRSRNRGVTWVDLGINPFRQPQSIDIDPKDPNRLYAALPNGIYKFSDGVWTEIGKSGGIPEDIFNGSNLFSAQSIVVDPNYSNKIYVGLGGYSPNATRHMKSYIFRSVDYGQTWQDIGYNLGEYSKISALAVDPRNGDLHASTSHGNYILINSSIVSSYSSSLVSKSISVGGSESSVSKSYAPPSSVAAATSVDSINAKAVNAPSLFFIKIIKPNSEGEDVKNLQITLNKLGFTINKTGPGSPGNETSYYGQLTIEAIKKFQCQYSIVCSGDELTTGYGLAGVKTIDRLNELASNQKENQIQPQNPSAEQASSVSTQSTQEKIINLKQQLTELMIQVVDLLNKQKTGQSAL